MSDPETMTTLPEGYVMDEEAFERRLQVWERSRHPSAPIWIVEYARYWKKRAEAAERGCQSCPHCLAKMGIVVECANCQAPLMKPEVG